MQPSIDPRASASAVSREEHATAPAPLRGEIAFVGAEGLLERARALREAGALVVRVPPLPMVLHGHLAEHIDERVERELAARGATSPCLAAWGSMPEEAGERLSDQLFRARTVGASGVALVLGSLAAGGSTTLDADDSATLRRLARATSEGPVVLLLDEGDAELGGFRAPIPLERLLAESPEGAHTAPREARPRLGRPPVEATHADDADDALDDADHDEANVDARGPRAEAATVGIPRSGPSDVWRTWVSALGAARGPQPLAALERLYVEAYLPLAGALASGLDDPRATRAYDEFRRSFERTYTDAFATFGVTGRRPRLVMDACDMALKQARQCEARATQIIVVDSLRYDLGELVREGLAKRAGFATLVNDTILWSALPTTTFRQLETLARGMDALRDPMADEDAESLRGRAADNVRRLRVGSRELHKLDQVSAMLESVADRRAHGTSEHVFSAFERIADGVADTLARHFTTVAPRTLALVVGDHGFCIDRKGSVTSGGASPEEVLVPAFSYLIGDLH